MLFKTRLLPLIVPALVLALMASFIGPGTSTARADWYSGSWSIRKPVTINAAVVSGSANLTNFPVMIQVIDSDLSSFARSDGNDIMFTLGDEVTKLSHEIEYFDQTSGNLTAWVKMPSLSPTTDTDIYMYYGNPSAANQEDVTNVWDSSFEMVQHMEETSGGANAITDSTSNNNNGTDDNTPDFSAAGKADGAIGFSGNSTVIEIADSASLDITSAITLEAWIYPTTVDSTHRRIIAKSHTSWAEPYYMYSLWVHTGGLGFGTYSGTTRNWQTNGTITPDTWQHVVGTQDTSQQRWYINGTLVATDNISSVIAANNEQLLIGNTVGSGLDFLGTIDEVRISSTARSADWIQTSYNNQNNPGSFLTFGAQETIPPTPTVATTGSSNVEETTATLSGNITNAAGGADIRGFEWAIAGSPTATGNWTQSGSFGTGGFSHALSGLDKGTNYSYRAMAHNVGGWGYGSVLTFTTKPDPPSTFTATAVSSSQIDLNWTKGAGANYTMIRYRLDTYPTSISDGNEVHTGNGTSHSISTLPPNYTIYFSAWSIAIGVSPVYSDDPPLNANATTGSGAPAVPTVIGGVVLKVNKASLLAPWVGLGLAALLITRLFFYLRKRSRSRL